MNASGRSASVLASAVLAGLASVAAAQPGEIDKRSHKWELLIYGQAPSNPDPKFGASVYQMPSGLGIQVDVFGVKDPNLTTLKIRMINELGHWFDPVGGNPLPSVGQVGRGASWIYMANFKWPGNAGQKAWIEVVLNNQSTYLEVPFGFFRDPSQALPVLDSPEVPARIQRFVEGAQAQSWDVVIYRVGKIQNDWQLSLRCKRNGDDRVELILYKEDVILGKSRKHWRLDEPSTSLHVEENGKPALRAELIDQRIHPDNMRRSDFYRWSQISGGDRAWGNSKIKVGDFEYQCTVPSSVYRN